MCSAGPRVIDAASTWAIHIQFIDSREGGHFQPTCPVVLFSSDEILATSRPIFPIEISFLEMPATYAKVTTIVWDMITPKKRENFGGK